MPIRCLNCHEHQQTAGGARRQSYKASSECHIVLMLDQFPRVLGGGERIVLRTADLLQSSGFRVSVITFSVAEEVMPTLRRAPCPIYLLPLTGVFQVAALRMAWHLGRFLRTERVAIVQTYFESSNLFGGIVTKALSRAKLVWNFRDMGILRERKHQHAYRCLRRLPDAVIAVSEQVKQHAIKVDGINPQRIVVVHNGLDLQSWSFYREGVYEVGPVIVTLGNIRPVKGHDVFLEAAAIVLKSVPAARFVIAGDVLDEAFFTALQSKLDSLGIYEQVSFPGLVAEPDELFRKATLFVLPSRSEGFSNAIVEAMSASLPVIATAVGGNAEAVQHGETGLIVTAGDVLELAHAMLSLLADPARASAMGKAGRRRAEALFTVEAMMQQMLLLYRDLVRCAPLPPVS